MTHKNSDWFVSWFDTSYYHLLYQNRNEAEAEFFLNNITEKLLIEQESKVWDMACGKGRHVNFLSKHGMHSCGTDLSVNSIEHAINNYNNLYAQFFVHDMRRPFRINYFDLVLNVFTSMGYFDRKRDDERVFIAAAQSMVRNGKFVVDFLNAKKVIAHLKPNETKIINDIQFDLQRKITEKTIIKEISILDGENNFQFKEQVRAYELNDFVELGETAGLTLKETFGNYSLDIFDEKLSDRLIMVFTKQ